MRKLDLLLLSRVMNHDWLRDRGIPLDSAWPKRKSGEGAWSKPFMKVGGDFERSPTARRGLGDNCHETS